MATAAIIFIELSSAPRDKTDRKTIQTWVLGTRAPGTVESLALLERIEHRYQFPAGYFRDILGGQVALFAILSALSHPDRKDGLFIEIAMQDVMAWGTFYAIDHSAAEGRLLHCRDGAVWSEAGVASAGEVDPAAYSHLTRSEAVRSLRGAGVRAVSVQRGDELLKDPDFTADALGTGWDALGTAWPLIKLPYRLSRTPGRILKVPNILTSAA